MHRARSAAAGVLTLAVASLALPGVAWADEPQPPIELEPTDATPEPKVDYDAPNPSRGALNVFRAFANVTFTNYVLFQIDWFRGVDWNAVSRSSIDDTLHGSFGFDYDPFLEDLLGHPLHGSLYFAGARATGLSFWESALFPAIGSLQWEFLGERRLTYPGGWTSKPSINDFVETSTSGPIIGEALYRLSSAALDDSATGGERVLRELVASVLSPMRGFNRLYTGEMWRRAEAPLRLHPILATLQAGTDLLYDRQSGQTTARHDPAAFAALDIHYGDLIPTKKNGTIDPLEFFHVYTSLNLLGGERDGVQAYVHGLLYGWSSDLRGGPETDRDFRTNNVFGLVQSFDYQGANLARFASLSIGPGDYIAWRWGPRRSLRIGMDAGWTYMSSTTTPFATPETDHRNYTMGGSIEQNGRLELGPYGTFDVRSRQFLTGSLDGQGAKEVIWYGRASYDVGVVHHVGIGIAPTLVYRQSLWGDQNVTQTSVDTQLYLRVRN